jgi:hypothetical protein
MIACLCHALSSLQQMDDAFLVCVQGWKAAIVSPRPNSGRQGLLLPIEDNRWQLIMTGLAGVSA